MNSPAQYAGFALSPDGRRLVFSRAGKERRRRPVAPRLSRWHRKSTDVRRGGVHAAMVSRWRAHRFTGPGENPPPKLFIKNITDTSPAVPVRASPQTAPNFASSWSADGRSIVSVRIDPASRNDLWVQRVQDGVAERLSFNTPFNESHGKVSPDNRWIVYMTDESGADEVWVARFPSGDGRRQVSVGGGTSPQWGEGSQESCTYRRQQLMAAPSPTGDRRERRARRELCSASPTRRGRLVAIFRDCEHSSRVERPALPGGRERAKSRRAADQHRRQLACAVESLSVGRRISIRTWEQLGNNSAQTPRKTRGRADQKAGRINKIDVPALSAKPPSPVQLRAAPPITNGPFW